MLSSYWRNAETLYKSDYNYTTNQMVCQSEDLHYKRKYPLNFEGCKRVLRSDIVQLLLLKIRNLDCLSYNEPLETTKTIVKYKELQCL